MDKPKEFWIYPDEDNHGRIENRPLFMSGEMHVIEYSAYEQLQSKFNEAVEVIKFYSNGGNLNRDIWFDEKLGYFTGKRAREALAELRKTE